MKCEEKEQSWVSLKASVKPGEEGERKLLSNPVLLEGRCSAFIMHYKCVLLGILSSSSLFSS